MKKLFAVFVTLIVLSACTQKNVPVTQQTQQKTQAQTQIPAAVGTKIYSVDKFVEGGFKDGDKLKIQIHSVTCYANSCAFEGGGRWGIGTNISESKKFYPYAGKGVDMVIQADPDCPKNTDRCYELKNVTIIFTGEITSDIHTPTAPTFVVPNLTFDHCNKPSFYAKEAWYAHLKNLVKDFYDDMSEACYSESGQLVVLMVPQGYCLPSDVYRYNIAHDVLEKAVYIDNNRGCLAGAGGFGQRRGDIISFVGKGGDAGCMAEMYFDYDYVKNIVELKKEYNFCEGDKVGQWIKY